MFAPATLTGTVQIEVSPVPGGDASTFRVLTLPDGTEVAIPAGGAVQILSPSFGDLRLVSSGAEAAEREFDIVAQVGC